MDKRWVTWGRIILIAALGADMSGCGDSGAAEPSQGATSAGAVTATSAAGTISRPATPVGSPSAAPTTGAGAGAGSSTPVTVGTGTNGSTGSPPPSGGSGTTKNPPPSGGSGTGTNPPPSGGPPAPVATVLFEQPHEAGIAHSLFVPLANTGVRFPNGVFSLVLWQPNPMNPGGQLVPTTWDAGSQTGFTPTSVVNGVQLGFQNKPGTTTAQMDGDTVGAYLNSADLPAAPPNQKMMITPLFQFTSGSEPAPFPDGNAILGASMDLQIPTAVGSDTYVAMDLLFADQNGVQISYGVIVFHNGARSSTVGSGYDDNSKSYMLNSPLGIDQRFVSLTSGSSKWTGTPWLGWQTFAWSISRPQFAAALAYLAAQNPGKVPSADPADYVLKQVHLNAEFHFKPAPAELGWSMRNLKVWRTEAIS